MFGVPPPVVEIPFLQRPLGPAAPTSAEGCEARVEWVLHNFTRYEKAYLYRLLYEGEGLRIDGIKDKERKEKAKL